MRKRDKPNGEAATATTDVSTSWYRFVFATLQAADTIERRRAERQQETPVTDADSSADSENKIVQ